MYQDVEKIAAQRFATFFLEALLTSELDPRLAFGLSLIATGADQIRDPMFDMSAQFFLEIVFRLGTLEESRGE
ncbi:MAG TPA: hypothetical protein VH252_08525 [Chthoniobacterales bacterium]|nr:hypothetical protein [Chthoniobacterales bacterium]